jgi:hypothetical protein
LVVQILRLWEVYVAEDDDTPPSIAAAMAISVETILKLNKGRAVAGKLGRFQ